MLIVYRIQDSKGLGWAVSRRISIVICQLQNVYNQKTLWHHRDLVGPLHDPGIWHVLDKYGKQWGKSQYLSKKWKRFQKLADRRSYWYTYKSMQDVLYWFPENLLKDMLSIRGIGLYRWTVPEHRCIVGKSQVMVLKNTKKMVERLHV